MAGADRYRSGAEAAVDAAEAIPVFARGVPGPAGRFDLPFPAFLFAALSLFLLLVLLGFWLVARITAGPAERWLEGSDRQWAWWLLVAMVLGFAVASLILTVQSFGRRRAFSALVSYSLLVCAGLAALGAQSVIAARTLNDGPVILDYRHLAPARRLVPRAAGAMALKGDAAAGQKLFALTCVTCHGPTGDGLNNLAPSLRTSDFLQSADMAAITRVVKLGRAVNDPANKSGKVMPAKGGNPFLTDQQLADLVAFVKSIAGGSQTGGGEADALAGASAGPGGPQAVQLARWVVPAAGRPAGGLVMTDGALQRLGPDGQVQARSAWRRQVHRSLSLLAMAVHGLFLSGVIAASCNVLFGWLLGMRDAGRRNWFRLLVYGWWLSAGVWLMFGLLPGMI